MSWRSASPASIVLPSPTSSQKRKLLGNCTTTASITRFWCGQGTTALVFNPDARGSAEERGMAKEAEDAPLVWRRPLLQGIGGRSLGWGALQETLADSLRQPKRDPTGIIALPERLEALFDLGDPMIGRRNGIGADATRPRSEDLERFVVLPPALPGFVAASAEGQSVSRPILEDPFLGVVVLLRVRSRDRQSIGPLRQHDPYFKLPARDEPCQDFEPGFDVGVEIPVVPFKRAEHRPLRSALDGVALRLAPQDGLHVARREVGPAEQPHGSVVLYQASHPGGGYGERRTAEIPGRAAVCRAPLKCGEVEVVQPVIARAVRDSEWVGREIQCNPGPDGWSVKGRPFWPFGANNVNHPSAEAPLASPCPPGPAAPRRPGRTRGAIHRERAPRGGRARPSS